MTRNAKWWLTIVAVFAVASIGGAAALAVSKRAEQAAAAKKKETPPLEFAASDVVRLQSRRLSVELALPGSVQAVTQATVRAKLSAEVKRVLVREGDRVKAGQVVAEFDTAQLRAQLAERSAGVMISNARGEVLAYALFNLQERGRLFVAPGDVVYEGQIVGESSRDGDMVVNPLKGKKLTNIRTQSKDENVLLTPPIRMSLEQAMEYIGDDELVEVTPKNIRLRKRHLREGDRKRAERS